MIKEEKYGWSETLLSMRKDIDDRSIPQEELDSVYRINYCGERCKINK